MAVIWFVCDRRQGICGWLGWNDIRYANGLAGGASAVLRNIQKSTSRKREGFGDSGTGILFCLWCVAFHALTGIMEPAAEVTHSFPVCPAGTFTPVTA